MNIAILLYDGVTALDAIGPYEVLACMPDADVHFVAKKTGRHHHAYRCPRASCR